LPATSGQSSAHANRASAQEAKKRCIPVTIEPPVVNADSNPALHFPDADGQRGLICWEAPVDHETILLLNQVRRRKLLLAINVKVNKSVIVMKPLGEVGLARSWNAADEKASVCHIFILIILRINEWSS
jgi:predicted transglutaminase-like cysteine proteinase